MKPGNLLVRVYGEKQGDQWFLIALEFDLAVQSDSIEEARSKLSAQIHDYVNDALRGEDREFAEQLLARKAPLKYRLKYWFFHKLFCALADKKSPRSHKAYVDPLPLAPTCA